MNRGLLTRTATRPAYGQIVPVRARRYEVDAVDEPGHSDEQTVVRLSCLDDALAVLWDREIEILDGSAA